MQHAFNDNLVGPVASGLRVWQPRDTYSQSQGDLSAYGGTGRVTYAFNDQWNNKLNFDAEYLSGDDPDTNTNEGFDPLWGRWPQWSELYVYTWVKESRIAEQTNLTRFGPSWEANPPRR